MMYASTSVYVLWLGHLDRIIMCIFLTCTVFRFVIDDLMIWVVMRYSCPYCAQLLLFRRAVV